MVCGRFHQKLGGRGRPSEFQTSRWEAFGYLFQVADPWVISSPAPARPRSFLPNVAEKKKKTEILTGKGQHYFSPATVFSLQLLSLETRKKSCCHQVRSKQERGCLKPETAKSLSLHEVPPPNPSLSPDWTGSSPRWAYPGSALFNVRIEFLSVS